MSAAATKAQRKAWNEAMRTAAGGAAVLPSSLQSPMKKRQTRSKSTKQSRRDKARKSVNEGETAEEILENQQLQAAAWMDALEEVPATLGSDDAGAKGDDDDEYDELEELEEEYDGKKKRKHTSKKTSTRRKSSKQNQEALPKRFQVRSLASILMEEMNREDGVAIAWLDNEASYTGRSGGNKSTTSHPPPRQKYCPVSGLEGIYTEPKTGIPYSNLAALEQIRERPPPWQTLGGALAYHEAVKSIRDE